MSIALKYTSRVLLAVGALLMAWALSLIVLPTTAATPSASSIQDLLFQRLVLALLVLGAGVAMALLDRWRKKAA